MLKQKYPWPWSVVSSSSFLKFFTRHKSDNPTPSECSNSVSRTKNFYDGYISCSVVFFIYRSVFWGSPKTKIYLPALNTRSWLYRQEQTEWNSCTNIHVVSMIVSTQWLSRCDPTLNRLFRFYILKALRKAAKMRNKADPYDTLSDTQYKDTLLVAHLTRTNETDLLKGSCISIDGRFVKHENRKVQKNK